MGRCVVCQKEQADYSCPKCRAVYCCLACYKTHNGGSCVAAFHQTNLQSALQGEKPQEQEIEAMHGILQRQLEEMQDEQQDMEEFQEEEELRNVLAQLERGEVPRLSHRLQMLFEDDLRNGRINENLGP